MKNSSKLFTTLFICILANYWFLSNVSAQGHPGLKEFTAKVSNCQVILQWTVNGGTTCNGITILRSKDTISFEPYGNIPGICGDLTAPVTYTYTDTFPKLNQRNYYRLELGTIGQSQFISTTVFDICEGGYLLEWDQKQNIFRLHLKNENEQLIRCSLYDSMGRFINELRTQTDLLEINPVQLGAGNYYFTLSNENRRFSSGTFPVIH